MNTREPQTEIINTTPATSTLAHSVLDRIEAEAITPRPRWQCLAFSSSNWIIWAISVALGALSLAIVWYVLTSAPYMLYEATHETAFTLLVELIPLLWITLLGVMLVLAVFEMRRTKRGYRFSLVAIVGSSVAFSVVGAVIFHLAGFSMWFDSALGQYVKGYMSFDKMEVRMWHNPTMGRYVGVIVVPAAGLPPAFLPQPEFRDADGMIWRVITESLTPAERSLLFSAKPVQIIGTSTFPQMLHLCAVVPRFFAQHMNNEDRAAYKQAYLERVRGFTEQTNPIETTVTTGEFEQNRTGASEPCHTIQFSFKKQ